MTPVTELPAVTRWRMLLRSFAVQGSWNYDTLIGLGFAFTLLPALRLIHGREGPALEEALRRHTELFNSHPYFSTVAVGAVARLEAEGMAPEMVGRFKSALRGSLGTLGDRLLWSGWRPMSVLLGIVLVLAGAPWWAAVSVLLLVYNALHLAIRVRGLRIGWDAGLDVGRRLREAPLQRVIEAAGRTASALIGAGAVLIAVPALESPIGAPLIIGGIVLGALLGLRTRSVMIGILAGVVALGFLVGLVGYGA